MAKRGNPDSAGRKRPLDFYLKTGSAIWYTMIGLVLLFTLTYGFWFGMIKSKVVALLLISLSAFVLVYFSASNVIIASEEHGFLKRKDGTISSRVDKRVDTAFESGKTILRR